VSIIIFIKYAQCQNIGKQGKCQVFRGRHPKDLSRIAKVGKDSIWVRVMAVVFNTTFNNISVLSWRSVLLVKQTGVPGENHRPVAKIPHDWGDNYITYELQVAIKNIQCRNTDY